MTHPDPREDALTTFWLIEWPADDHTPLRWFCGGRLNSSLDWNKAVRFVRKQDAEAAIAWMRFGGGAAAVEHGHVSTDGELTRQSEGGVRVHHHPDNDQSSWAVQAIVRAASKKLSASTSPTPYVRPAESAVVLTLIDALTGLESSYEEGEGVSYARLEARSAIKAAQDFLAAPTTTEKETP